YYVTAVYSNGCESQAEPVVVTINPLAQSPVLQDNDYCTSEAVILNASNINGTITWYSDAALTTNLGTGAPLNIGTQAAGTYNYFAQVNNGTCNSTVEGNTIEVFAIPSAPIVNPATICEGEQANLTITSATNTNWYSDAAMTNLLFVGSTFTTPVLNTNTTYYVTNEDVNGCESTSSSVLVTVISKPNAPNAINDTICKNQAATLTATGSGGALIWYADITLNNQVGTGNSFTTPSLNTSTTYYVVENNGTCIGDASPVSAIINSDITITIDLINNVSCFGGNDGDIYTSITGGNGVYTYSWTGGGANEDLINVAAGIYVLTVTDGIGCSKSASATIGSPSDIDIALDNLENVSCNGLSDGSIAISVSGGAAGYTYSWSDGAAVVATTNDLNNVAAGSYTLTVTDTKLCTETYTASITENVALAGNITANNILCYGATSSASVAVSGGALPYTYLWSNFDNGTTATNLPAGSVSVVVTDDNQCTLQLFANITAPSAALEVTDSLINNVTCFNGNDGAIYTSISGGTAPYSVSWSPNVGAAKDITNLAVGIYTITVTDANNCTTTATYEVENALEIISTMAVTNPSCFGEETGMIVVGNSGGTAPYNYSWNTTPPQTGLVAINLAGDMTYTVTITDINGCTAQNTASVVYPTEMTVTSIPTSVSCISTANGSVTVAVQNGNRPYQYELNGFLQSDSVFDNLDGGNYIVFVEDNNNCTASATFDINTVSGVEAELEGAGNDLQYFTDNLYIVRGEEVSLNVNLINDVGNPIVGYSWTPSSIDTSSSESTPSFFPDDNVVVTIEVLEDINGSICSVFDTLYIDVSQESVAFVPTAFSPNNNGANNFFEMNVLGAENLNVQIFNRWGEVVFSNPTQGNGPSNINDASLMDGTNPRGAWDGKFNGEDVPTGAYAYKIEVTYFDGTVEVISGSVTVIR
ncbi:MAG: gliding motility-associated C-terminal domain-containing protein, partial [Chitinophagales bacterium]